ncbi:hypothetical protein BBK82_29620 [Lentzea guizhouensis]|uniref:DUF2306 domain-containing protein n=1 Tax=Lentzea guizhouensis TaxID=1586287 RepID=A0A1B2HPE1_9PSEU|nr:DUF2306 domain-containing protein [Lentzea guizhouensis]ANZ39589.1 hypothetical protein BBK82_29620 [Lentzea guizhouensis]
MTSTTTRTAAPRQEVRWWRRPWIVPLMLVAAAFLVFSVPPYLTLDPAHSRLTPPEGNDLYYPLLVAHVLFGAVAMATACFQVWPAFRARHRVGHRITGRVYVYAGALPASVLGLYIGWHTTAGPSVLVANLVGSALWLAFTVAGLYFARKRRYDEHRRWMSRSFALAMSIVLSRVINIPAVIVLSSQVDTAFAGSEVLMRNTATSIGVWLSPLLLLLVTDWVLERRKGRARRQGQAGNNLRVPAPA